MYQISHTLIYQYEQPVTFAPHLLRLRPRSDVFQQLHQFDLHIEPTPAQLYDTVDLDGNTITSAQFSPVPTNYLTIRATSQVTTHLQNPFQYFLEPGAIQLPMSYPQELNQRLQPYLQGYLSRSAAIDPIATQLGQDIWLASQGQTTTFLNLLNQRIYQTCQYLFRENGDPLPAGITWLQQGGSCRDFAVLFMEVCRSVGLATRFVSGYQESSAEMLLDEATPPDQHHLHAWAEVYLPGAGWRGYDPTHGLAAANDHIALVATPWPQQCAPIAGAIQTGVGTPARLSYELNIQKSSESLSS